MNDHHNENLNMENLMKNIDSFKNNGSRKIASIVFNYDGRHVRQQDDV